MTKQNKFIVKIPISQQADDASKTDYKLYHFSSVKDVADFLECTENTIYSLRTKRLKLKHENKMHLEGIVIEKIPVFYNGKKDLKHIEELKEDYKTKLLSK